MAQMPSIEVLEHHHAFPCSYTLKAIGAAENHFVERVVAAVQKGLGAAETPEYSTKETSGGKHVSLTFELPAESATQVVAVYEEVHTVEGLLLIL